MCCDAVLGEFYEELTGESGCEGAKLICLPDDKEQAQRPTLRCTVAQILKMMQVIFWHVRNWLSMLVASF